MHAQRENTNVLTNLEELSFLNVLAFPKAEIEKIQSESNKKVAKNSFPLLLRPVS